MGAQFWWRFIFQLLTGTIFLNKSLRWFYNERHHGKGRMDRVGGTFRNVIFRKVKSCQMVVYTLKEFSDAAMTFVPSIITLYLSRSDESESIYQAPCIPEKLSIHKFVRQINDRRDCSITFFKLAVDQEAFHTQWYNKADNVVCGHEKSDKSDNEFLTCGDWYTEWMVTMSHMWTMVPRNMFWRLNLTFNLMSDGNNVFFISLIWLFFIYKIQKLWLSGMF